MTQAAVLNGHIDSALGDAPENRHIQSLLVGVEGELLVERYFRDRRPTDLSNIHSVTKSVIATLAGIAIADGTRTLETTLGEILERERFDDEPKRDITIRQLLTMTSGLDPGSPYDIDEIADRGESWLSGPLAAPLRSPPGMRFSYNNGAAHVLSVSIARAYGTPLHRFAEERLFAPLEIGEYRWPRDPEGNPLGWGHLELRPRDLFHLGELYRNHGRRNSKHLLTKDFVSEATREQSAGGPPESVAYGYLWWVTDDCGHRSYFAGGYGGQYVTVVPDLAIVAVTTGDVDVFNSGSGDLRRLVSEAVIPSFTSAAHSQPPSGAA